MILNCEFGTRTMFMLNEMNILSVNQRWIFNILVFVFKMKNKLMPKYLQKKIKYNHETHNRNTRQKNEIRLPDIKNENARKMVCYDGMKMFNKLPIEIREENSLNKYKNMIKKYVIENFSIR